MQIYVRILMLCAFISQICHGMNEQPQVLSSITPITSFDQQQAADALDAADKDTLVLFDVDDTLITTKHPYLKFSDSEHISRSTYYQNEDPLVIESSIIARIKDLQSRAITVIALTSMASGRRSTIPSLEQWRYEKLKKLGIDFNNTHFSNVQWEICDPTKETKARPAFYNGVLVTDFEKKGPVLQQFLEKQKYTPQRIIFFDDQRHMLESVQRTASALSIHFQGFHYDGSQHVPPVTRNPQREAFQMKWLRLRRWLNDETAQQMLDQEAAEASKDRPDTPIESTLTEKTVAQD